MFATVLDLIEILVVMYTARNKTTFDRVVIPHLSMHVSFSQLLPQMKHFSCKTKPSYIHFIIVHLHGGERKISSG